MNYFPYPYMPNPYQQIKPLDLERELINIKKEINSLKQRIKQLEKNENNDYLTKDDGLYMI